MGEIISAEEILQDNTPDRYMAERKRLQEKLRSEYAFQRRQAAEAEREVVEKGRRPRRILRPFLRTRTYEAEQLNGTGHEQALLFESMAVEYNGIIADISEQLGIEIEPLPVPEFIMQIKRDQQRAGPVRVFEDGPTLRAHITGMLSGSTPRRRFISELPVVTQPTALALRNAFAPERTGRTASGESHNGVEVTDITPREGIWSPANHALQMDSPSFLKLVTRFPSKDGPIISYAPISEEIRIALQAIGTEILNSSVDNHLTKISTGIYDDVDFEYSIVTRDELEQTAA